MPDPSAQFCPRCGQGNPPGAPACVHCGLSLPVPATLPPPGPPVTDFNAMKAGQPGTPPGAFPAFGKSGEPAQPPLSPGPSMTPQGVSTPFGFVRPPAGGPPNEPSDGRQGETLNNWQESAPSYGPPNEGYGPPNGGYGPQGVMPPPGAAGYGAPGYGQPGPMAPGGYAPGGIPPPGWYPPEYSGDQPPAVLPRMPPQYGPPRPETGSGPMGPYGPPQQWGPPPGAPQAGSNRVTVAVVAILLGCFGIHKFMLGLSQPGILLLVLGVFTCGLGSALVGLIEGIIYLTKSDAEFYQAYVLGRRPWF